MTKKPITKTTLAVSLDIEIVEKLKEVAKQEERSVSQIVQRALVQYLPTVQNEISENEQKVVEKLLNRMTAALTTCEMKKHGVEPSEISLEDGGRLVIRLQKNADNNTEAANLETSLEKSEPYMIDQQDYPTNDKVWPQFIAAEM